MGSSTTESAPDDQVSPVYDNTGSGDEGKVAALPEPNAPATEKVAVRRAASDPSLPLVVINF